MWIQCTQVDMTFSLTTFHIETAALEYLFRNYRKLKLLENPLSHPKMYEGKMTV